MRCKACNVPLSSQELKRKEPDEGFCSRCISESNKEFKVTDREYHHGNVSGVLLDGSTLYVDVGVLDESETEEPVENTENNT